MSRRARWIVAAVFFVLGLAARLWRIDWGLPGIYEEGFAMDRALGFWPRGGSGFDWNPHWFNYPTLYSYLQFAVQWVVRVTGDFPDASAFRAAFEANRAGLVLPGRVLSALLGAATAPVVFLAALRLIAPAGAVLAGAVATLHAVHVEKSRFLEVDVPTAFFVAVALWFLARFHERPVRFPLFGAAFATGLAASTKYPGAVFLLNVLAALWFVPKKPFPGRVGLTVALGATALFAFLLGTPFALLDFAAFQEDFRFEGMHVRTGHLGASAAGVLPGARAFLTGFGPPLGAVLAASIVFVALFRRRLAALALPGLLAIAALLAFSRLQPAHYALPALPAAAFAIGALWAEIVPRLPRYTGYAVFTVLLLWPAAAVYERGVLLGRPDSRTTATEWIEANVAEGRIVLTEAHGPQLHPWESRGGRELPKRRSYRMLLMPLFPVEPNRADRFYEPALVAAAELVVTVDAVRSRYEEEPARFPKQNAIYRTLENEWVTVDSFPASGLGSTIRLYRKQGRASATEAVPIELPGDGRRDPEFLQFARNATQYLLDRGRRDQALRLAEAVARLAPESPENRALYATILGEAEPDRAVALLEESFRQNPNDLAITKNLAIAHFQRGALDAGIAVLEDALARGVEDAEIHGNLGSAYRAAGDEAAAVRHFRRFLQLDPAHERAAEIESLVREMAPRR